MGFQSDAYLLSNDADKTFQRLPKGEGQIELFVAGLHRLNNRSCEIKVTKLSGDPRNLKLVQLYVEIADPAGKNAGEKAYTLARS